MSKRYETDRFFEYFRNRACVARCVGSDAPEFTPDQHLLVGAGLDALARYWARSVQNPRKQAGQERMAAFLASHGGHDCFDRVAGAMFLADIEKKAELGESRCLRQQVTWIRAELENVRPAAHVAYWNEDYTAKDVERLRLKEASKIPAELVNKWRYGGAIYKEHRCAWVHEFDKGQIAEHSPVQHPDEPHYFAHRGRRVLTFSGAFLMATYDRAINSFHGECISKDLSPLAWA